jgi:hypothetical protein
MPKMRELSTQETTQYLERLIKTEMSLTNLKEVKRMVDSRISSLERELSSISASATSKSIREPLYRPPVEPQKPQEPEKHKVGLNELGRHYTLFGWAVEFAVAGSANSSDQRRYQETIAKYNSDIEKYHKSKAEYESKYQFEMEQYREKVRNADSIDAKKKKDYPIAIGKEQEASKELSNRIAETNSTLEKLYNLDIVFPKYREIVPLCSMYEYFVTGRVLELKGPNGAYNLFESELRQNIIIAELKLIGQKLEQIKQNQYMLYSELKKSNEYLSGIGATLTATLESVNRIADAVDFNNLLTANIADNVEAIKYISLIN